MSSVVGRLVAEIQPAAVRRCGHAVDDLGVGNLADDLVGGRVDQMNAVAGGIGLDDDRPSRLSGQGYCEHDGEQETDAPEHGHGEEPPAAHSNTTIRPGT